MHPTEPTRSENDALATISEGGQCRQRGASSSEDVLH